MELDLSEWNAYIEDNTLWIVCEKYNEAYETTTYQPGPNDTFIRHDMTEWDREEINNLGNMKEVPVPKRFINKLLSTND